MNTKTAQEVRYKSSNLIGLGLNHQRLNLVSMLSSHTLYLLLEKLLRIRNICNGVYLLTLRSHEARICSLITSCLFFDIYFCNSYMSIFIHFLRQMLRLSKYLDECLVGWRPKSLINQSGTT